MRKTTNHKLHISRVAIALVLLLCGSLALASAQDAGRRPARSLTSEDLLNRPVLYTQPIAATAHVASSAVRSPGSGYYRDPAGIFTLNFPNNGWRVNPKGGSAGRAYNQRSFRRMDAEGFASATANVYVVSDSTVADPANLSAEEQRRFAERLASRFLSSNASVVSVQTGTSRSHTGLRIIADQVIARRVAVRAVINVFERQGRLYVVVLCASPETFDASQSEFDAISNSLASSVVRS
ncbi:MAG: hypothetical protein QOJ64_3434 [Acidobacteriota bacterium]|jgi:hypothetical protein|nr:hypothetical protein [Acidobacteriota bacterium]